MVPLPVRRPRRRCPGRACSSSAAWRRWPTSGGTACRCCTARTCTGRQRVAVDVDAGENELVVRCAALTPLLTGRRARPRWKTYMVEHQNLRWFRTSLLGRIPGWAVVPPIVGPWRPVRLLGPGDVVPTTVALRATCDGDGGVVTASFDLVANAALADATPTDGKLRITRLGAPAASAGASAGTDGDQGTAALATVNAHGGRARRTISPGGDGAVGRGRALVAAHARFAAAVRGMGRRRRPVAPARRGRVPDDRGRSRATATSGWRSTTSRCSAAGRAGCRSTRSRSRRRRRSSSTGWRSPGRPT